MRHVRQRTPTDCAPCCLAMAARCRGLTVRQVSRTLGRLTGRPWRSRRVWPRRLEEVVPGLPGRPVVVALVTSPRWLTAHSIVAYRGRIYDPAEPGPVPVAEYGRRRLRVAFVTMERL